MRERQTGGISVDEKLKDKARALAQAIKDSDAYKTWLQAQEDLKERHAAQVMLRDLQAAQAELMRKVQAGEPVSQQDEARWQRTVETVAANPYVAAVLQAEQTMGQLLSDVNERIAQELGMGSDAVGPTGDDPEPPVPKSRLWVPGQS